MSFPTYPTYKESRGEWLKQVPAHWDTLPCRAIVKEQTAKNERLQLTNYLSLMANIGVLPYEQKGDVGNKKPDDLSKCKLVAKGDFVINSMNYGIGSYGVSDYDGVCSPVYVVLTPRRDIVEPGFSFRIFENRAFQTYAQSFGNGILEHRCAINWDILKSIRVPVPPRDEQRQILVFLDQETAKIDALIAEQRQLMELLKEKRQAVISHAVTKGLDPRAPMKDSGIEWMGKVPAHWRVMPLGRVTLSRCDGPFGSALKSEHYAESGVRVIRLQNVRAGAFDGSDEAFVDTDYYHRDLLGHDVIGGDLLVAGLGDDNNTVGRACIAPANIGLAMVKADCFRFRLDLDVAIPEYVAMALCAGAAADAGDLSTGSTRSRISLSIMATRRVPIPPISEQMAVSNFVCAKTSELDGLVAQVETAIHLLRERRSALISAAVTGQIDVRNIKERRSAA